MVAKMKNFGRPRKTSKRQNMKLEAFCLENRKCIRKLMKHIWYEIGQNSKISAELNGIYRKKI